jgi:hypothetical protein
VGGELGAGGLERGLVDLVLQHPVAGELAGLDVIQDALHLDRSKLRLNDLSGRNRDKLPMNPNRP